MNESKAVDYLDVALGNKPIEGSSNTLPQSKDPSQSVPIQETTIYNVTYSADCVELGKAIGRDMVKTYNKDTFEKFILAIREGFDFQQNIQKYEDAELNRIGALFEETIMKK